VHNEKDLNEKQIIEDLLSMELMKPYNEMDADLIKECSDFLLELDGYENTFSNEEISERIKKIPFKQNKKSFVRVSLIASTIAALLMIINLIAFGFGYSPSDIFTLLKETFIQANINEPVDIGGFTVVKHGKHIKYESFNEFIDSEQIDMIIPKYLPYNVKIENIIISTINEEKLISVLFDKALVSMQVDLEKKLDTQSNINADKTIENGGIVYYIYESSNDVIIVWEYSGNLHTLTFLEKTDQLEKIIKSIKE